MTVDEFIQIWRDSTRTERSASQEHFLQLCHLLGEKTPAELDPDGVFFTFEKGANKTTGTRGWADVWLKGCFAWEYKGKGKDLKKAFVQLQQYALALENPPLLIVSDMETIEIHTNFTNTVAEVHLIQLEDLRDPQQFKLLKTLFNKDKIDEVFKPAKTRDAVTLEMAEQFTELAQRLRSRGHDPHQVAHFINRLVFCMFAEDIGILPKSLFTTLLESVLKQIRTGKNRFQQRMSELFAIMQTGGDFGLEEIDWFNGGLFDDDGALPLEKADVEHLLRAARHDWKDIEPSIFGTLFERGLDPDKRSQLGAHYTDRDSILRILEPVIFAPLNTEWEQIKLQIQSLLENIGKGTRKAKKSKNELEADGLYHGFLERLNNLQVLDPACGSGNFLYLTLLGLKDLENKVLIDAEMMGLERQFPRVSPKSLNGIEVNPYAAELARVTVWIGQIQWVLGHGYDLPKNPILEKLDNIECCDALLTHTGIEKNWKTVDFIVGNPPFLGNKKMISILGEDYVNQLRALFQGRVAGGADLVCYWFEKARAQLEQGRVQAVGLVSTNSIRGGSNRKVLDRIGETGQIFQAWSDEPWINEGAAVRVSLVCFTSPEKQQFYPITTLDNQVTSEIYSDLTTPNTAQTLDLTKAKPLAENASVAFQGTIKVGAFDIAGDLAREWVKSSFNPNGKPNSDVLRPWANGMDVVRRYSDTWIIDFGVNMSEDDASLYEKPFEYVVKNVKPKRVGKREERANEKWWILQRSRPEMRLALKPLFRFIITSRVSKYRLFIWMDKTVLPDSRLYAIAREDDTTFGILHCRFHELWSLKTCSWHGVGNDPTYNAHSCFETFPFPDGLSPNIPASEYADNPHAQAIAKAAQRLNELRDNWLNPPNLVQRVPEIVAGYPERILPMNAEAEKELKKRTLTNLYNLKPQWLVKAHEVLDNAVATAYGWEHHLSDDDVLARLLALNLARSEK
ncbi:class I SAM-dependent DNA methyltransferase [Beggiatoa leptomitoformis]|uniref:site-specific DNA-methyltransferase (adenine-specific) n=1 Tax=Beggiatoa leptomitoformis TaxID=288004 RepID=A0A2N9YB85_9GAMM|nr:class I SAM-dependent DNA methyltransferase [Beggiatoa leptomitoformis]ALG66932.1 class I SAM-dependent DNA methyltransferase [Beggiatoa leptomitoformis]AUI67702.1 class I SAM-dependent DNA methyltransferase [Beggiatoa leptomitoformis]